MGLDMLSPVMVFPWTTPALSLPPPNNSFSMLLLMLIDEFEATKVDMWSCLRTSPAHDSLRALLRRPLGSRRWSHMGCEDGLDTIDYRKVVLCCLVSMCYSAPARLYLSQVCSHSICLEVPLRCYLSDDSGFLAQPHRFA